MNKKKIQINQYIYFKGYLKKGLALLGTLEIKWSFNCLESQNANNQQPPRP